MGWASTAADELAAGREIVVRPRGGSMRGRVEDGQEVRLAPVDPKLLHVGDVVFVRWKRGYLLHLIKALEPERVLIGNNLGRINGWVDRNQVLGRLTSP
jgi:hypothetical protein